MSNLYWACVDELGHGGITITKPKRCEIKDGLGYWAGLYLPIEIKDLSSFPLMTWKDEPIKVRLTLEVVEEKSDEQIFRDKAMQYGW